jgi:AsmA protein
LHLKLNEVDWKLAAFPNPFEDLSIDISAQDDDLIIRNVQGRFGKNDFAINGKIEDILLPAGERDVTKRTTLHLGSRHLNLSELNELFASPGQGDEGNREGSWDLPPLHLSLDIDSLLWDVLSAENISGELHTRGFTKIILHPEDESAPVLTTDFNGSIRSENLLLPDFEVPMFSMQFSGKDRLYDLEPSLETVFGTRGTGNIHLDFSRPERAVKIQYKVENFLIRRLLRFFDEEPSITGQMDLFIDLTAIGNDKDALNSSLTGRVALDGHELTLHGIDIDDLLAKFKRSQRFNLVDLGAYMMAGPVGAVATKGFDFASLLKLDPSAKSAIPRFTSQWEILNGIAEASDVAMITNKSRVAIKGGIDFPRKRFQDLAFAIVDSKGCALISQSINGPFENPEISGIRTVEALLAPVFNIFKVAAFGDCPRFYSGSLRHPTR